MEGYSTHRPGAPWKVCKPCSSANSPFRPGQVRWVNNFCQLQLLCAAECVVRQCLRLDTPFQPESFVAPQTAPSDLLLIQSPDRGARDDRRSACRSRKINMYGVIDFRGIFIVLHCAYTVYRVRSMAICSILSTRQQDRELWSPWGILIATPTSRRPMLPESRSYQGYAP